MILPVTYFDNAATTYPKPEQVYLALDREFRQSGNAGRGTHPLALNGARQIFESRECIADFLGVSKSERLIFTPGCTQSLNVVLNSLSAYGTRAGAETLILISGLEHNAIMRPLNKLQQTSGLKIQSLSYSVGRFCDLTELEEALQTLKPAMFILTEGSNVTGEVADLSAVATLCKTYRVPLLVDAAQTAGRRQSCLNHDGITFWCASAHKNLMGPQGLGLLYVHADFSLDPLVLGGTGSASEQLSMPEAYPDHLESGTMPAFLIAGLKAGVTWLREVGTEVIIAQENLLVRRFLGWASNSPFISLYGQPLLSEFAEGSRDRLPIVSFAVLDKSAEQVADFLDRQANIAVRSGLHCSVQAHRALGTEKSGLVRTSFGFFNTVEEVDRLCEQLERLHN
jgi:selenocysteine lyase/cysteine desulfurase